MISIKSDRELDYMRKSGAIVAQILDEVEDLVKPGMKTSELDAYAEKRCEELGVRPAFKGYKGFPGCFCLSINDEVVHGIPGDRELSEGDIISIDFGVIYEGWYGDSARTIAVGQITEDARKLLDVTQQSLMRGIEQCVEGNRLYDIGYAIQNYVEGFGYGVVREFVGHGIGRALHEDPQVPNFGQKGKGIPLKAGMVLAIEPMINMGSPEVRILEDGWTAATEDQSLSAHFEHTIAIRQDREPEILTQSHKLRG